VVLFEMLTGKPPFDLPELGELFLQVRTMPAPRLRQVAPTGGFSSSLEDLLVRAMAKAPGDRFPSAAAMVAALEVLPETPNKVAAPAAAARNDQTVVESSPAFLRDQQAVAAAPPVAPVASEGLVPKARRLLALARERVRAGRAKALVRARWLFEGRSRAAAGVLVGLVLLASLGVILVLSPGKRPPPAPAPAAPATVMPAPAPAPSPPTIDELIARGERDQAIARLLELRREQPRDAGHAGALARLYFEKRWWADGLASFRAAIALEAGYREDHELIAQTIAALDSDKANEKAAALLRELGPAARPQLQAAAKSHPKPRVRTRAAELLRPPRKPFLKWFGGR
jgi:hypothetical protein